jgi:hypothetical protein
MVLRPGHRRGQRPIRTHPFISLFLVSCYGEFVHQNRLLTGSQRQAIMQTLPREFAATSRHVHLWHVRWLVPDFILRDRIAYG